MTAIVETTVTERVVVEAPTGTIVTETATPAVIEVGIAGPQGPPGEGSGATALVVQEGESTVVAEADTVDFAAADFDVTVSPSGEANIALAVEHTGSSHAAVQAAAEATAAAALTAHEGASNPHPGYLTPAEGDAAYDALGAAAAALAGHVAAADPHTGYQLESEKGSAGGYAPLDSSGLIGDSFIPASIARDSEVTAAVNAAVAALVNAAPGTLDTLDELAAALGDDPNFVTTITTLIGTKVAKADYNAHTILAATSDDTPAALTVGEATIVGRLTGGNIAALTPAQIRALLSLVVGTDVASHSAVVAAQSDADAAQTAIDDHIADPTAAHDAEAIFVADVDGHYTGADVEAVLAELGVTADTLLAARRLAAGGYVSIGHSYTQLGGGTDSGSTFPLDIQGNFSHLIGAAFNVPTNEVRLLGKSGAAAYSPSDGGEAGISQGTGAILRHILPPHVYSGLLTPPVIEPQPNAALYSVMMGYNDLGHGDSPAEWLALGRDAFMHGLVTTLSRIRAKVLHYWNDAALSYSGTWSDQTTAAANRSSAGTVKRSSTNGNSVTYTIPKNCTGGHVALCVLAGAGAHTLANGAGSSATALIVDDGSVFPSSGSFDITIDGVAKTVSSRSGNTLTLAVASTWADNAVIKRAQAGRLDITGTAANATGSSIISGQGRLGLPVHKTIRIPVTRADAGKTIIFTIAALGTNEVCDIDSAWIEAVEERCPVTAVINQPHGPFALGNADTHTLAQIQNLNAAIATVVDLFDSRVVLVDVYTDFAARFGATCSGATGTGTSFDITLIDPASSEIGVGSILKADVEAMLVTGISGTGSTRTVTVERNYQNPLLTDFGSAANHANGAACFDIRWIRPDKVHPSGLGHALIAAAVLEALRTLSLSSLAQVGLGGYVRRDVDRHRSGYYLYPRGNRQNTTPSLNNLVAFQLLVPDDVIITELGCEVVTAGSAGAVARLGLYTNGQGRPGDLVYDTGTVATTSTGVKSFTGLRIPLRRGIYWLALAPQVATAVFRGINEFYSPLLLPVATAPSGANPNINAVLITGVSGALPNPYGTTGEAFDVALPVLWAKADCWITD